MLHLVWSAVEAIVANLPRGAFWKRWTAERYGSWFARYALVVRTQVGQFQCMALSRYITETFKPAVDLIYPPRCPLCGDAIGEQTGVCAQCWMQLAIPGQPSCSTCQRPLTGSIEPADVQCAPCMMQPPVHDGIAAGTFYNDASRKLVLSFKHGRRIALADMLARLMVARLPQLDGEWLFVPVPLHRWRLWGRGFNQAALLARRLSAMTGQRLLVDGLVRIKLTQPLGGMGRKERERMLQGAIRVQDRHRMAFSSAKIVLVDDVLTSGATSDACVKALKKAGAQKVVISCFARVLSEGVDGR